MPILRLERERERETKKERQRQSTLKRYAERDSDTVRQAIKAEKNHEKNNCFIIFFF